MTEGVIASLAVAAWRDHQQTVERERARETAQTAERLTRRLRSILPAGYQVEVRTEPSLVRPGKLAAVADLDGHVLAVEAPHVWSLDAGAMYALVECAMCGQQVPARESGPVSTLADLGRAVESGPGPHRPEPRGESHLDPAEPCPGGPAAEQEREQLTPGEAMVALIEAMVSDTVERTLDGTR